jgi:hypothetical protein
MSNKNSLVSVIEISENAKLGKISATYVTQKSCPTDCAFYNSGCYAELGMTGMQTRRLNKNSNKFYKNIDTRDIARMEAREIKTLSGKRNLRLHVVGDAKTNSAANELAKAAKIFSSKYDKKVYSYTHAWKKVNRKSWGNISILASCETSQDVKQAQKLGYATAIVVDHFEDTKKYNYNGIDVIPCPSQTMDNVTCDSCKLCMQDKYLLTNKLTIAFSSHGTRKRMVSEKLTSLSIKGKQYA